jgi:hypothetical protein
VTAIDQFALLISTAPREHDSVAIGRSRAAFIDTLACMFAGSTRASAQRDEFWSLLNCLEQQDNLTVGLGL